MSTWSSAVIATTPYLYWRMGEASGSSAADSSGNSRTGTFASVTYGAASLVPSDAADNAITIDNANDQVSHSSVSFSSIDFSAMVVVKGSGVSGGLFASSTTDYLNLSANIAGRVNNNSVALTPSYALTNLFDGTAHLVIWIVKATMAELWVDGTMVASGTHSITTSTRTAFQLKRASSGPSTGTYDELTLWNRGLTSTEIGTLTAAYLGSAPQVTASLSGSGALSATVVEVENATASLTGSGVLTAAVVAVGIAVAGLTGSGSLAVESAPVLAGGLSGSGVLSAVVEIGEVGVVDASLSGSGALSASVVGVHTAAASLAGTGALSAAALPSFTVEAGLSGAGSLSAASSAIASVAASLEGSGVLSATVEFDAPPGTLIDRSGGRSRGGYASVTWEPAVVPAPSVMVSGSHRRIRAAAYGTVTMDGTRPTFTASNATAPRTRTRILVGGKDVSFFRGVPTPEPGYQLAEPLLWGPTTIELPQVSACFETAGMGDLSWCAKGKPVKFQRVTDGGTIVATDYRGIVVAHDYSGRNLRIEVGGHSQGRASIPRWKPMPIFRDTLDLGRLAWAAIRDLGLRFEPRLGPTTGMKSALFGDMSYLDYIREICAKAWQRNGTQWTLMPDDDATYTFAPKDTTTVHFTVFCDDARAVADLRSDAAEEPNRFFTSGVTPKGQRVRFGVYPRLKPGPAAPYPFDDDSTFGLGTTDDETDTGDGVTVMVKTMWSAGLLSLEEADGTYDADVTRAIMSLQGGAGLTASGNMNPATWAALFDLDNSGYTTRGSQIEPAAQDPRTQRYLRSASGAIIGKNPTFDPSVLIVDRPLAMNGTRHQMREWSEAERDRFADPDFINMAGTITINTGAVLVGDVAVGATVTPETLMDVRRLRPGMNGRIHHGGRSFVAHLAVVDVDTQDGAVTTAKLMVDTQARDAPSLWDVILRNQETRRNAARRWTGNRASGQIKDSISEWDEIGGLVSGDRDLDAGWNIIEVVGGQEGTVSRIRTTVQNVTGEGEEIAIEGVEHAISVTGRMVTAARMNHLNPLPLSVDGTKAWETQAVRTVLDAKWQVYSAGTFDEPCGYGAGRKGDDDTLTGLFTDDAGFSYRTDREPLLYLAVWVAAPATLLGGRVMWNQLEAGA